MLILLDENLPHKLRQLLVGHDVRTANYQGWAGLSNGALLKAAEDVSFDAILTADQGIRYQQNRRNSLVALIVLSDNDESDHGQREHNSGRDQLGSARRFSLG
jgi:hypothetical protein